MQWIEEGVHAVRRRSECGGVGKRGYCAWRLCLCVLTGEQEPPKLHGIASFLCAVPPPLHSSADF
jgi:hypothetical protein